MNIIKFLRGTRWGADPQTLIIFYKSFVRSIIDYGSYIYFLNQATQIDKLEKIQFTAIRLALDYRLSTPTNILLGESKLESLMERTKLLCSNCLKKVYSNKNLQIHQTLNKFKGLCNKNLNNNKLNKRLLVHCISQAWFTDLISRNYYNVYAYDYKTMISDVNINTKFGKKNLKKPQSK